MRDAVAFQRPGQLGDESSFAADEHGHPVVRHPVDQVETDDLGGDPFRLGGLLIETVDVDPTRAGSGLHRACRPRDVTAGHALGGAQHRLGGAERGGEDEPGRGAPRLVERLGEARHVGDVGAPEAVDRLVGVGRHRDAAVAAQGAEHLDLGGGGVLVLVDEDVPPSLVDRLEDGGRLGEHHPVVDPVVGHQCLAIANHEIGKAPPVVPAHLGDPVGVEQLLARSQEEIGDLVGEGGATQERPERDGPPPRLLGGEQGAHQVRLLGAGEDLRGAGPPAEGEVGLDDPHRQGMERRDDHRCHTRRPAGVDPPVQVGDPTSPEGEHDDVVRRYPGVEQVQRAPHQEFGLARARPAHHELGAMIGGHRRRPVVRPDQGLLERMFGCAARSSHAHDRFVAVPGGGTSDPGRAPPRTTVSSRSDMNATAPGRIHSRSLVWLDSATQGSRRA